ncbi:NAD(P)H-hydrate dehydratase [Geobacter argillaceus]|uniref:Bifunctional NAD(P)H-hydrate repair enzyme n=1 Tax=Geobacter argillaceus TaxID=345631 RepID=A0A562V7P2_9BACT|nr:NAD(P)H-hydrate dehydratase [Geobacter argillaceus]TWJ13882.1 NAD(P)H-hydrate epimerase [Geobacter argillaceus]
MKVVTGAVMQQMDRRTIEEYGVPGLALMENAGRVCALAIHEAYGNRPGPSAVILAGKGNNGGDGYVIARMLREMEWSVMLVVLARREEIGGDALVNLERLPDDLPRFCLTEQELNKVAPGLAGATVVVDALLGTGLKSEVQGLYAATIAMINDCGRPVVAVDIPSGINAASGKVLGCAVRADLTATFALAKLGHVLYPGADYAGELLVRDIGIPRAVADEAAGYDYLDPAAANALLCPRSRTAHKGSNGHCLVIAGATGKTGAAAMAANSAVRAGAGLVTLAVPATLHAILEVKTTEAMTVPLQDGGRGYLGADARADIMQVLAGRNAVALGPGLGWHSDTAQLVRRLVELVAAPLVIDADGLNAVSEEPAVLQRTLSSSVILTPHPGEMARLAGITIAEVENDRIGTAGTFAREHGVYLVLKGARTVIAAPDGRVAVNGSGNPGMATGGMGDVLAGVLTALLAQGYDPFTACCLGVFCHGLAGDLVAQDKGEIGMSAMDVQEMLPYAFKRIGNGEKLLNQSTGDKIC